MNWQPPAGPGPGQWPPQAAPVPAGYAPAGPVYELSGWWRRVGAVFIDGIIVGVIAGILAVPLGGWQRADYYADSGNTSFNFQLNGIGMLIWLVVFVVVVPLVMSRNNGRTIGKMATGIRVVREDGRDVDFGFALFRELVIKELLFQVVAIITLGIATLLNYLWPLWDSQHCALHDKIVKSRVVRMEASGAAAAVWPQPAAYGAPPMQPMGGVPAAPYPPADPFAQPAPPPPDPFARPAAPAPDPFAQPLPPHSPAPPPAPPPPAPASPAQPTAPPMAPPAAPAPPTAPPVAPQPPAPPAAPPMAPPPPSPAPPAVPPPVPPPPAVPPQQAPMQPPPMAPPQPPPPQPPPASPPQYQPPPGFENPVPESDD
ncbi:MAG: RDD family protein [Actinobacteria bacterium]|nr:RDD family protein [Actinomycetota bacterium]